MSLFLFPLQLLLVCLFFSRLNHSLVVLATNVSYPHSNALFGAMIDTEGIVGALVDVQIISSNNVYGCSDFEPFEANGHSWILMVKEGGGCTYSRKARVAQKAKANGLVVGSNTPSGGLKVMKANEDTSDIFIPCVYIDYFDHSELFELSHRGFATFPSFQISIAKSQLPFWRIFNILLIRILIPSLLLALVYFTAFRVRRKIAKQTQTTRQEQLKALEIIVFKKTDDEEISCAICLDDFHEGDRLRLLPCQHKFHVTCVDPWLVTRKPNCPLCKKHAFPTESSPIV